ncbi:MAG TPA: NAD(P)/FAD-dependent oxidoreductase [Candidatus Baltobacteraceae bacterium]|jgi:thioredoxin reductase
MEYEVIVVGGGAAGLSAALILGRSRRHVLVCDEGRPRNVLAREVHGFLSREGIDPRELLRIAREQIAVYPTVTFADAYISDAREEERGFVLTDASGAIYRTKKLLLATGMYDELPDIEGLTQLWGYKAFVCPYCDAWEYRGKSLAVIGKGARAEELAAELRQWSQDVCVCEQDSVTHIEEGGCPEVVLRDGSRRQCDAIFLTAPLRLRYPLVDALGLQVRDDGAIAIDDCGRTSVHGCYAAGDAVTTAHQLVLAAASGASAAMAINEDLLEDRAAD